MIWPGSFTKTYCMKHIYIFLIMAGIVNYGFAQPGSVSMKKVGAAASTYPSITSAYAAIPSGTADDYLIEMNAGYNGRHASELYPIKFGNKQLTTGTITIRPAAGNNNAVLQYTDISHPVLSVVVFDTAANVILDGRPGGVTSDTSNYLKILCYYPGLEQIIGLNITGGSQNNIVRYVSLIAQVADLNTPLGYNLMVTNPGADINRNNTITHCKSVKGLVGLADYCTSSVEYNEGTKFTNNYIEDAALAGIVIRERSKNALVENNIITYSGTSSASSLHGILSGTEVPGKTIIRNNQVSLWVDSCSNLSLAGGIVVGGDDSTLCSGNEISIHIGVNQTQTVVWGLGFEYSTGNFPRHLTVFNNKIQKIEKDSTAQIAYLTGVYINLLDSSVINLYNNFIALPDTNKNATVVGIQLSAEDYFTANIYFNSIFIGGTSNAGNSSVNAVGMFMGATGSSPEGNLRVKNNLIAVDRKSEQLPLISAAFVNQFVGSAVKLDIDYNSYYVSDTVFGAYVFANSLYTKGQLANYKADMDSIEQHSQFKQAKFVSGSDLHLASSSKTDTSFLGIPVIDISADIDGDPRNSTRPTMGADEGLATLPVTLLNFTGKRTKLGNLLSWTTTAELNNSGFEIEKSIDGKTFEKIGWQQTKADNGFSITKTDYIFLDAGTTDATCYYRLKQINTDGHIAYSNTVVISAVNHPVEIKVYPNPSSDIINIHFTVKAATSADVTMVDASGKIALQQQFSLVAGENEIRLNVLRLKSGVYYLKVVTGSGELMMQKMIKE